MKTFIYSILLVCSLALGTSTVFAEMVNINQADAATLQQNLAGVGKVKAQAIVDYRKKNGNFKSLDDLKNVKGIGEGLIKKNRKNLSLNSGARSSKVATSNKNTKSVNNETKVSSKKPAKGNAEKKSVTSKSNKNDSKKKIANNDNKSKTQKASSKSSGKQDQKKAAKSSSEKSTQLSKN